MEQEIVSKDFLESSGPDIYKTLIRIWISDNSDETEIKLFCYSHRSFSKFWDIFGGLCNKIFHSWIRGDLKLFKPPV